MGRENFLKGCISLPASMIIGVTGGTGFIGSHLVDAHVSCGHEVRVLTRNRTKQIPPGAKRFIGDLKSGAIPDDFLGSGLDIIYHCAAEVGNESEMWAVNFVGTRILLEKSIGRFGRWVQLSSVGVYGSLGSATEVKEDTPLSPRNAYELSKAQADSMLKEAADREGFQLSILRPSIVFGTRMRNKSLEQLGKFIRKGFFVFIGPQGASANYVPIGSVVDALKRCASNPLANGQIYNLSHWTTIENMVHTIARAQGTSLTTLRLPKSAARILAGVSSCIPGFPLTAGRVDALSSRVKFPSSKIELQLGFRHERPLEESFENYFNGLLLGRGVGLND